MKEGLYLICAAIALVLLLTGPIIIAYALDNPQMDKSHCAPGVQGRCIEIKPLNPCGERK